MHLLKTASRLVLLCGLAGVAAAPAAFAQEGPRHDGPRGGENHRMERGWGKDHAQPHRMRGRVDLIGFSCGERSAERMEIAFVRLNHRLDLTEAQQPLFEALKSTALTEQTRVSDVCKAAEPARARGQAPDIVAQMKGRLAVETARVAAIEATMGDFEAFFTSLSDTQKSRLAPRRDRFHKSDAPRHDRAPRAPRSETM